MAPVFLDLLAKFRGARLLCVGDLMVDYFVYGNAARLSPEAPVPVFQTHHTIQSLGGAGNVVRNLSSLGVQTDFLSVRGQDAPGIECVTLLGDLPNVTAHLTVDNHRPTTTKTRYLCQNQQLLRVDHELSSPLEDNCIQTLKEAFNGACSKADGVIVSDYGKGVLTPRFLTFIIETTKKQGIPLIVDPKGTDYSIYRGATLLTPNLKELKDGTGLSVQSDDDVVAAACFLINTYNMDAVLVTRSEKGMTLVMGSESNVTHIPTDGRDVYDVSGAGDTVVATLAAAMAVGGDLPDAAYLANRAAGIVVGKVGTAVVTPQEIENSVNASSSPVTSKDKVRTLTGAVEDLITWRRQGYRVGLTNGCFDLLHPGHVDQLQKARLACDRLIVAVNSDDSVRRLKGTGRPIQNTDSRTTILSSLACVDMVVVFEDDTPLSLIMALKPDVLIKGADYRVADIVGAREVISWGGDVQTIPLAEGHSTTGIIHKIKG